MHPQYENMHTREQSVPFLFSLLPSTHTHTHTYTPTILFMSKKPGNGTSVSALINTMNNRGKGCIYTPQNDLVFNKTSYIT